MFVALMSAKGAPGVTTALCLTVARVPEVLLVEADPSGGDLECWSGPHGEAGLVGLATSLHPGATNDQVHGHAVEAVPGVRAVTAPTTATAAGAALTTAGDRLGAALAAGRRYRPLPVGWRGPTWPLVVCRPALDSVEHARDLVVSVGPAVGSWVALVLVGGEQPHGPGEIAKALGVPVLGVLQAHRSFGTGKGHVRPMWG